MNVFCSMNTTIHNGRVGVQTSWGEQTLDNAMSCGQLLSGGDVLRSASTPSSTGTPTLGLAVVSVFVSDVSVI